MASERLEPPRLQITRLCRSIRETAKLRQEDVAELVGDGRTKGQISYFESGRSWPRDADEYIGAYAKLAGTTAAALWTHAIRLWTQETGDVQPATSLDAAAAQLLG